MKKSIYLYKYIFFFFIYFNMKRRIHLKRKIINIKKLTRKNLIFITLIALVVSLYFSFVYLNNKFSPILLEYAEAEVSKLTSVLLGKAVTTEINDVIDVENLYIVERDNDGNIQSIDYNSKEVNEILIASVTAISTNIKYLSEGKIDKVTMGDTLENFYDEYDDAKLKDGVIFEIPMGTIFKNPFLSNLGPKIPVKFYLIGDVTSNLNTTINSFAINSAYIETNLNLKVSLKITLPINSKIIEVQNKIPLAIKVIQGKIPEVYLNGYNQNTPILSLPVE